MPTYAYEAIDPGRSCDHCRPGFEVIQRMTEPALARCPRCQNTVRRILFAPAFSVKGNPVSETDYTDECGHLIRRNLAGCSDLWWPPCRSEATLGFSDSD